MMYIVEDTALATADTVSNVTLYAPAFAGTEYDAPSTYSLRTASVFITGGLTANKVLAIIRKVPNGYSNPAITVANGLGVFVDYPNILAYGMVNVAASSADPMLRIDLTKVRNLTRVVPGDKIILQVVPNASSTNQIYNAMIEYSVGP